MGMPTLTARGALRAAMLGLGITSGSSDPETAERASHPEKQSSLLPGPERRSRPGGAQLTALSVGPGAKAGFPSTKLVKQCAIALVLLGFLLFVVITFANLTWYGPFRFFGADFASYYAAATMIAD